jgi:hypothetical protein
LEDIQARRREEIRAWADAQIAAADASLVGVPLANTFEDDFIVQEIPDDQKNTDVTNEHEVPTNSVPVGGVDTTAAAEVQEQVAAVEAAVSANNEIEEKAEKVAALAELVEEVATPSDDDDDDEEAPKPKRKAPRKATDPA